MSRVAFVDFSRGSVRTLADLSRAKCGRLTCLNAVTEHLAKRGHEVTCIGKWTDFDTPGGVQWRKGTEIDTRYDALVMLRGVHDMLPQITARRRFLWVRDLPHAGFIPDPPQARFLHATVYLSRYAENVWKDHYPVLRKVRSFRIPNGVDKRVFFPGGTKDPNLLLYASNPNRGLKRIPMYGEALRHFHPKSRIVAFSSHEALHPGETGDHSEAYALCREHGIDLRDPLPQEELAEWIRKATAVLLPSEFPEICSNLVLQSLACGTPIVATGALGATPEWVRHGWNGLETKWRPWDYQAFDLDFLRKCKTLLERPLLQRWLGYGARRTRILDWSEVGAKWERILCA